MGIRKQPVSVSQLAELLGVEPSEFVGVVRVSSTGMEVWTQEPDMQTSGTCKPLSDNTSGKKKR